MYEVDDGIDPELKKALKSFIREREVPETALRLDSMPWNAVSRCPDPEFGDKLEILCPPVVVAGKLVLIESSPGCRPGLGNKRIFDTGRPPKRVGCRELSKLGSPRK
jgi:hypothetical protein